MPTWTTRRLFLAAAVGYLFFVLYGSFVPLEFHSGSLAKAWAQFTHPPPLRLTYASRSDWAVNLLLFLPVPFLWLMALGSARGAARRTFTALLFWSASAVVSIGTEFAQEFFPPRNASLRDVAAQTVGAFFGAALWWLWGERATQAVVRWKRAHETPRLAEWILWPYLAVIAFFSLFPFDFTASPAALRHKWRTGRIFLIPFSQHLPGIPHEIYAIVAGTIPWIPVTALAVLSHRISRFPAWVLTVLAAAWLEVLQVLVVTRVSDFTDVLLAACGAGIGVGIGDLLRRHEGLPWPEEARRRRTWRREATAGLLLWLLVLVFFYWYPFDFHLNRDYFLRRIGSFRPPPLTSYFFASPLQAIAQVVRKTLFFVPLGGTLAIFSAPLRTRRARWAAAAASLGFIAFVALLLEMGQAILPSRFPDLTDVMLEIMSGGAAFWAVRAIWRRKMERDQGIGAERSPSRAQPRNTRSSSVARAEKE